MSRKQQKMKMKHVNAELAELAQKKQLKLAQKKFRWSQKRGFPADVHTYTNLMNAHVRCEDYKGAAILWQQMLTAGIIPNVVTFTTILKAHAQSGDIVQSLHVLMNTMGEANVAPNIRTVNTFLRGCSRVGAVASAYEVYKGMSEHWGVVPDSTSIEYVTTLLCQALQVKEAGGVISTTYPAQPSAVSVSAGAVVAEDNPAVYLSLARAHTILGDTEEASKWLQCTAMKTVQSAAAPLRNAMKRKFDENDDDNDDEGNSGHRNSFCTSTGARTGRSGSSGGSKGSHKKRGSGEGVSNSVTLFLEHRLQEIQAETSLLQSYVNHMTSGQDSKYLLLVYLAIRLLLNVCYC